MASVLDLFPSVAPYYMHDETEPRHGSVYESARRDCISFICKQKGSVVDI
jgi:hypothetical protein